MGSHIAHLACKLTSYNTCLDWAVYLSTNLGERVRTAASHVGQHLTSLHHQWRVMIVQFWGGRRNQYIESRSGYYASHDLELPFQFALRFFKDVYRLMHSAKYTGNMATSLDPHEAGKLIESCADSCMPSKVTLGVLTGPAFLCFVARIAIRLTYQKQLSLDAF